MPRPRKEKPLPPPPGPPHRIALHNSIVMFFHCRRCLEEMPEGTSPREWAQLEVGWTQIGLQVWCRRHEVNIMHVDFEGAQHPARMGAEEKLQ